MSVVLFTGFVQCQVAVPSVSVLGSGKAQSVTVSWHLLTLWAYKYCDNCLVDCTFPCIHGNVDAGCSRCTCQGNWEGPDCSSK